MNFSALRRRHKRVLVDHAFRVFLPTKQISYDDKEFWIERLLNGHDFNHFIEELKKGVSGTRLSLISSEQAGESKFAVGRIRVVDTDLEFHAGLKRRLNVLLLNYSADSFCTTPEHPLFIAYHWYTDTGEVYEFDGVRTPIEAPVEKGQESLESINLTPPAEPGKYELMVTMVHEGRCWMEDAGLAIEKIPVEVQDYDGRGMTRHGLSVFKQIQAAELEEAY